MTLGGRFSLFTVLCAVGCSSGTTSPSATDGGVAAGDGATIPATGPAASGTLGGTPLTVTSGLFYISNGQLNLILSTASDLCSDVTAKQIAAGSLQLEIYDLPGTTAGTYVSPRTTGSHIKSSCASGAQLDKTQLAFFEKATAASVTVATISASSAEGTIDLAFADGSKVKGSFTASACAARPDENATCR